MMDVKERARLGVNQFCVDCARRPFGGGMRCLPCFQARARAKAGDHIVAEPPSNGTYAGGCRCRECRKAQAAYQRRRRARAE